jgi:hypothetical protein
MTETLKMPLLHEGSKLLVILVMTLGPGDRDDDGKWWRWWRPGQEAEMRRCWKVRACRVASRYHSRRGGPGGQILHKKPRGVKLNGTRIVGGEPTNRKKIMCDVWGYENVVEIKRPTENRDTY